MGIMDRSAADGSGKNEAIAVHHHIPFYALDFLVGIKPVGPLTITPFDALGIQRSDRWTLVLISLFPHFAYKFFEHMLDSSFLGPFSEIIVHQLPFWIVMRQHPPLAPGDQQIEHSLKQAP